jgi:hypothetical protein
MWVNVGNNLQINIIRAILATYITAPDISTQERLAILANQ